MPINFKAPLSSSVANNTFLDKTIDDIKKGKLGLYKVTPAESGAIDDVQVYINEIASISGVTGEADPNANVYSSTEIITDGDDRKVAIGKLDAQAANNRDAIAGAIRTTYANELITEAGTVSKSDTLNNQVRRVSGNAAAVTVAGALFGDCTNMIDGVAIILRGTDATNTVTITHSDIQFGSILNGDATLGLYDEIELMYDSVVERFIEQRRNF